MLIICLGIVTYRTYVYLSTKMSVVNAHMFMHVFTAKAVMFLAFIIQYVGTVTYYTYVYISTNMSVVITNMSTHVYCNSSHVPNICNILCQSCDIL